VVVDELEDDALARLDIGGLDLGSSTAAGPSTIARLRNS
jgi:hypothetical protein